MIARYKNFDLRSEEDDHGLDLSDQGKFHTVEEEFKKIEELKFRIDNFKLKIPRDQIVDSFETLPSGVEEYENLYGDNRVPDMEGILLYDLPEIRDEVEKLQDSNEDDPNSKKGLLKELERLEGQVLKIYPYHLSDKVSRLGDIARGNKYKLDEFEAEDIGHEIELARESIGGSTFSKDKENNKTTKRSILHRINNIEERLERYKKDPAYYAVDRIGYFAEKKMEDMVNMSLFVDDSRRGKLGNEHTDYLFDKELLNSIEYYLKEMRVAEKYVKDQETREKLKNKIQYIEDVVSKPERIQKMREKYFQAKAQIEWLEDNYKSEDKTDIANVYGQLRKILKEVDEEVSKIGSFSLREKFLRPFVGMSFRLYMIESNDEGFKKIVDLGGDNPYNKYMDAYTVLGLKVGATAYDVKKAYRRLAKETHPDMTGEKEGKKFREINDAYEILKKAGLAN